MRRFALAAPLPLALIGVVSLWGTALLGAPDLATFRSAPWGLTIRYPADLATSTVFKENYFDRGAWRVSWAADTGPGTRLVAFSLPDLAVHDAGGDSRATAELRIGASRDPDVVAGCLTYGMNSGNNAELRMRTVGGVTFTEVPDNSDGEMGKTFTTDDFRAVHRGTCFAIDLAVFVGGTSNRPPAVAPADLDRLKSILDTIHFD